LKTAKGGAAYSFKEFQKGGASLPDDGKTAIFKLKQVELK
jgi:hypothetical protein